MTTPMYSLAWTAMSEYDAQGGRSLAIEKKQRFSNFHADQICPKAPLPKGSGFPLSFFVISLGYVSSPAAAQRAKCSLREKSAQNQLQLVRRTGAAENTIRDNGKPEPSGRGATG
jgi:hypothetical protein